MNLKVKKMLRRLMVGGVIAAAALGATFIAVTPAQAASGSPIHVAFNGKCLDADLNRINTDGAQVQLWDCNGSNQQKWYWGSNGTIHSGFNGKCLDADANNGRNGTKVQLWGCNNTNQQKWSKTGNMIVSGAFNRCLDADVVHLNENGAVAQLWGCNGSSQQNWYGIGDSTKSTSCSAYTNAEVWQTSNDIARVRERVCVAYDASTVYGLVQFQVDWPSQCSLSVGMPPSASVSCPLSSWVAKNHHLRFNSIQAGGDLKTEGLGQGSGRCKWGAVNAQPSSLTRGCYVSWAPRAYHTFTVTTHDTGGDVQDDGDGLKVLTAGSTTFQL